MQSKMFRKEEIVKSVKDNVRVMFRKTIDEASSQEVFQAVSLVVKDTIIDQWLATQNGVLPVHGISHGPGPGQ